MIRYVLLLLAILHVPLFAVDNVQLSRPSLENVEKEVARYSQKRSNSHKSKWIKRGCLVGGLSLTAVFTSHLLQGCMAGSGDSKSEGGETQNASSQNQPENLEYLVKRILVHAAVVGVIAVIWQGASSTFNFFKRSLWDYNHNVLKELLPLLKMVENSVVRFRGAMGEFHVSKQGSFLFDYYLREMKDSFALFVKCLERFCGVLIYELRDASSQEEVLIDCLEYIKGVFLFCDYVVGKLEGELHSSNNWNGFNQDTFLIVNKLDVAVGRLVDYMPLASGLTHQPGKPQEKAG